MNITYWTSNPVWMETGLELQKHGHKVIFNEFNNETELVIVIGAPSAFDFEKTIKKAYDNDRFIYKGKVAMVVLDIPVWRLIEETWLNYYDKYKQMLKDADYVFSISYTTSKYLKSLWDMEVAALFAIFNEKIIKKHMIKTKRKHQVICVGRFVEHKAFHQVIEALRDTDYKLLIIGHGGPLEQFYKDVAKEVGIDLEVKTNVSFKELVKDYCESEVCIHPSIFEGFSFVQKEALMCGTPVLHSDIPVHLEFHKNNIATFKTNDIEDLRNAIKEKRWKPADTKHFEHLMIEKRTEEIRKWLKTIN